MSVSTMLRGLALATAAAVVQASSKAHSSPGAFIGFRQARNFSLLTCFNRYGVPGSYSRSQAGKLESRSTRSLKSSSTTSRKSTVSMMGVEVVPVLGGLEAAAALWAGHLPGVFIGAATVAWASYLKDPVKQRLGPLRPVGSFFGGFLTFLTVTMLGVRTFTAGPDTRFIEDFPARIAHPEGCTRIAAEAGNKGIDPPVFEADPARVQEVARRWFEVEPRTKIETDVPGYLHAKCLTLIFGFPDSVGVKIFKNKSGKTEVWLQSELRVGQGDLGVNLGRMKRLLAYLHAELQ